MSNNNIIIMEGEKSIGNNINKKAAHPCTHCNEPCFGFQCKKCHLKMIADCEGDCSDCEEKFMKIRKDGTSRKRCLKCQDIYNSTNIAICPGCDKSYHATMKDGRVFNKCFDCYQKQFHNCIKCDIKIKNNFEMCSSCYQTSSYKAQKKCETRDCLQKTTFKFCKSCYESKNITNQYSVSTCQHCGYRAQGNFKFCTICTHSDYKK